MARLHSNARAIFLLALGLAAFASHATFAQQVGASFSAEAPKEQPAPSPFEPPLPDAPPTTPDNASSQAQEATTTTPPTEASPDAPPPVNSEEQNLEDFSLDGMDNWKTSIMFSVTEIRQLYKAIAEVRRRKRLGLLNPTPTKPGQVAAAPEPAPLEAPAFYLDSILFTRPGNWTIWINGTKIASGESAPPIPAKILTVNEKKVVLQWEAESLDEISPNWVEAIRKQSQISVEKGKKVRFTLYPNQTFVSRAMQVIEGRAVGSQVVSAPQPAPAPETSDAPAEGADPAAPPANTPAEGAAPASATDASPAVAPPVMAPDAPAP